MYALGGHESLSYRQKIYDSITYYFIKYVIKHHIILYYYLANLANKVSLRQLVRCSGSLLI